MLLRAIALLLFAYLLGSIPFGLLVGKLFYRVDVREHGSGNIGATNAFRTLGPVAGVGVWVADVAKGLVPVLLAKAVLPAESDLAAWVIVVVGLVAVLGHTYSIFLGFDGGKGMSTAGGMVIGLWPIAAAILIALWALIIAITRYVSLASITIAALLPVLVVVLYPRKEYIVFSIIVAIVLVYRHRSNISRLLAGTELRFGKRADVGED